jgi:Ca2+-binding EF-hand superfamily protein
VTTNSRFIQNSAKHSNRECDVVRSDMYLHDNDAVTVIELLGLDTEHMSNEALEVEGAYVLLQEKESSIDELKQAFAVFDVNGDGFISATELMSVMSKLRLEEGLEMEDFERMIGAYDKDFDGKINFQDFKLLLEDST